MEMEIKKKTSTLTRILCQISKTTCSIFGVLNFFAEFDISSVLSSP